MAQPLLEREGVLAEVEGLIRHAARGDGRVLLLRGEAGIGKSAAVRRIVDTAPSQVQALVGSCDPLSTPRPFGPVIDMVHQLGEGDVTGLGTAIRTGHLESIYALLLETLAGRGPWIWVVEDVQWADGATLDLLRFVARRINTLPVLVIVTYRDDDLGRDHPLSAVLGDLANDATLTRIGLAPLSVDAVRILAAGSGVNAGVLYGLTDGNPFFVGEVLASHASGHDLDAVPRSVAETVWGRLARLSATGRAAAEAAAVCGPQVHARLIEVLCPGAASGLSECLRAAVLSDRDGFVRFRHELIRRAVLEQIPDYDRRELHERALAALAEPPIDPDVLASLALHADQSGNGRAIVQYAPAAAEHAAAMGAHADAAELYALALRHAHLADDGHSALWLEHRARECYLGGDVDAAAASWREAIGRRHALGEDRLDGDALRRTSNVRFLLGREDAAVDVGLTSAPSTVPERLYFSLETTLGSDDGWRELESTWRDAMNLSDEAELGGLVGAIVCWAATARADVHRAERYVAECEVFCREHHLDVFEVLAAGAGTRIGVYRGDWDRAAGTAEDILTRPNLTSLHRIWPAVALALVRARRGQTVAPSLLEEALDGGEADDLYRFGPVWAARAEVAWLAGDDDGARAEAAKGMKTVPAHRDPSLYGQLLRWMHPPGSPETTIVTQVAEPHTLEVAGDWEAAASAWTRRGSAYDSALAHLRGDMPAVEAALNTFRQLGAHAAVDRARQRLGSLKRGSQHGHRADTRADPHHLTRREREILELIAVGNSDAAIAGALFISQRTVNNHVHAILNKLGVHNRTQAASHARGAFGPTRA